VVLTFKETMKIESVQSISRVLKLGRCWKNAVRKGCIFTWRAT